MDKNFLERERDVLKGEGWCSLFVQTHFLAVKRLPTSLTFFLSKAEQDESL